MEYLLPSEVARLVYGYLECEKCFEAANAFLKTSEHLRECYQISLLNRKFSTNVMGYSLYKCLDQFCAIHRLVQDRIETMRVNHISSRELVDQVAYLIDVECKGHSTVMFNITVPVQEDINKTINETVSNTRKSPPPIPFNETDSMSYSVSMEGLPSTPTWSVTNTTSTPGTQSMPPSSPIVHCLSPSVPETTNLESLPGNCKPPEAKKPRAKRKQVTGENTEDKNSSGNKTGSISDSSARIPEIRIDGRNLNQKQNENENSGELESVIQSIVHQTQSDPLFKNFLDEFLNGEKNIDNAPTKRSEAESENPTSVSKNQTKGVETDKDSETNVASRTNSKESKDPLCSTEGNLSSVNESKINYVEDRESNETISEENDQQLLEINTSAPTNTAAVESNTSHKIQQAQSVKKPSKPAKVAEKMPSHLAPTNHQTFSVVKMGKVTSLTQKNPSSSSIVVLDATSTVPTSIQAGTGTVPLPHRMVTLPNHPATSLIKGILSPSLFADSTLPLNRKKNIPPTVLITEDLLNPPKHGIYTKDVKPCIMVTNQLYSNLVNIAPKNAPMTTPEKETPNTVAPKRQKGNSQGKVSSKGRGKKPSSAVTPEDESMEVNSEVQEDPPGDFVKSQKAKTLISTSTADSDATSEKTIVPINSPTIVDSNRDFAEMLIEHLSRSNSTDGHVEYFNKSSSSVLGMNGNRSGQSSLSERNEQKASDSECSSVSHTQRLNSVEVDLQSPPNSFKLPLQDSEAGSSDCSGDKTAQEGTGKSADNSKDSQLFSINKDSKESSSNCSVVDTDVNCDVPSSKKVLHCKSSVATVVSNSTCSSVEAPKDNTCPSLPSVNPLSSHDNSLFASESSSVDQTNSSDIQKCSPANTFKITSINLSTDKINSEFKKLISPVIHNRTKKLSLSTPRDKKRHVRALDFCTPTNRDGPPRTALTCPKQTLTGNNSERDDRFKNVCRSQLFESPSSIYPLKSIGEETSTIPASQEKACAIFQTGGSKSQVKTTERKLSAILESSPNDAKSVCKSNRVKVANNLMPSTVKLQEIDSIHKLLRLPKSELTQFKNQILSRKINKKESDSCQSLTQRDLDFDGSGELTESKPSAIPLIDRCIITQGKIAKRLDSRTTISSDDCSRNSTEVFEHGLGPPVSSPSKASDHFALNRAKSTDSSHNLGYCESESHLSGDKSILHKALVKSQYAANEQKCIGNQVTSPINKRNRKKSNESPRKDEFCSAKFGAIQSVYNQLSESSQREDAGNIDDFPIEKDSSNNFKDYDANVTTGSSCDDNLFIVTAEEQEIVTAAEESKLKLEYIVPDDVEDHLSFALPKTSCRIDDLVACNTFISPLKTETTHYNGAANQVTFHVVYDESQEQSTQFSASDLKQKEDFLKNAVFLLELENDSGPTVHKLTVSEERTLMYIPSKVEQVKRDGQRKIIKKNVYHQSKGNKPKVTTSTESVQTISSQRLLPSPPHSRSLYSVKNRSKDNPRSMRDNLSPQDLTIKSVQKNFQTSKTSDHQLYLASPKSPNGYQSLTKTHHNLSERNLSSSSKSLSAANLKPPKLLKSSHSPSKSAASEKKHKPDSFSFAAPCSLRSSLSPPPVKKRMISSHHRKEWYEVADGTKIHTPKYSKKHEKFSKEKEKSNHDHTAAHSDKRKPEKRHASQSKESVKKRKSRDKDDQALTKKRSKPSLLESDPIKHNQNVLGEFLEKYNLKDINFASLSKKNK
nr:PREDICTED: uncharacterized protein LOC109042213 [Bemisia tabaci]